jgi:hypothetical protein
MPPLREGGMPIGKQEEEVHEEGRKEQDGGVIQRLVYERVAQQPLRGIHDVRCDEPDVETEEREEQRGQVTASQIDQPADDEKGERNDSEGEFPCHFPRRKRAVGEVDGEILGTAMYAVDGRFPGTGGRRCRRRVEQPIALLEPRRRGRTARGHAAHTAAALERDETRVGGTSERDRRGQFEEQRYAEERIRDPPPPARVPPRMMTGKAHRRCLVRPPSGAAVPVSLRPGDFVVKRRPRTVASLRRPASLV